MLETINKKFLPIPKLLYLSLSLVFYSIHQCRGDFITSNFNVNKSQLANYLSLAQTTSFFFGLYAASFNDASGKQKYLISGSILCSILLFQTFFLNISTFTFWMVYTAYFTILSITMPILDKVVIEYLEKIPNVGAKTYGNQRVWATFGFVITNYIVEEITKTDTKELNYSYVPLYNYVVGGIAIALSLLFVQNVVARPRAPGSSSGVLGLLKNKEYLYFILIILLSGITRASMTTYLSLYYKEILRLTEPVNKTGNFFVDFFYSKKIATTAMFGNFLEVLIFFNGSLITTKLGLFWPILLSQFCQIGRFMLYYIVNPKSKYCFEQACGIELLKGANYGLLQTAAVQLATKLCPVHLRSSSQVLYTGSFVALGTVLSGLLFGPFFSKDTNQPKEVLLKEYRSVFLIDTLLTVAIVVLFAVKYVFMENLLFSKANYEEKFRKIEEMQQNEDIVKKEYVEIPPMEKVLKDEKI